MTTSLVHESIPRMIGRLRRLMAECEAHKTDVDVVLLHESLLPKVRRIQVSMNEEPGLWFCGLPIYVYRTSDERASLLLDLAHTKKKVMEIVGSSSANRR